MITFIWCVVTTLVIYGVYKLWKVIIFLKAVNKIPGPKALPFIGNMLELQVPQEKIFKVLEQYGQKYPIYRLVGGFDATVFISTPEDTEIIISGIKNLAKSALYTPFLIWLNTGLLTSTDEKWHTRRKILTSTFHFSILQQFALTFIEKSERMVEELESLTNKEFDIIPLVTKYTFLTICETALGTNVENEEIEKYRKAIYKMGNITIHRVTRPWFYYNSTYAFSPKCYEAILTSRLLHRYSRNIIKKRKENFNPNDISVGSDYVYKSKKKLAMLDMLLYSKSINDDIDEEGIREEVDTFMFEGHDTTSSCLSFTLMLLACNKNVQNKVVEEIKELLVEKNDRLSFEMLNNMKYLERAIKESLRLYPSVPMFGRILEEDVKTHTGYVIPAEANIMIRSYDMHRNPKIYPDPEKFDPDRFLPEEIKKRHPYAYLPFSGGPRNCIGQKFALLELKAMISAILMNFELIPVDTPETITLVVDLILHPKDGIRVKFVPRRK